MKNIIFKKYLIVISTFFVAILVTSCSEKNEIELKLSKADLIKVEKQEDAIGFYKSSLTKLENGNIHVWVNFPGAEAESQSLMAKVADLLVEISCKTREIKIVKATDLKGSKLEVVKSEWENPPPTQTDFYNLITLVCEVSKKKFNS